MPPVLMSPDPRFNTFLDDLWVGKRRVDPCVVTPEELAVTCFPSKPSWFATAAAAAHRSSTSKNVINIKSFWIKIV